MKSTCFVAQLMLASATAAVVALAGGCGYAPGRCEPSVSAVVPRPAQEPAVRQAPALELEIHNVDAVKVGEDFTFEVVLTNRGELPADKLAIRDRCDPGLEHTPVDSPSQRDLGSLGPGESRKIEITCHAARPGAFRNTVEVLVGGQVVATDWSSVTASGPDPDQATPEAEALPDLGPPLVDNPDRLKQLHPFYPVWFDPDGKQVVMVGAVCQRETPLELFACVRGSKEHESVVAIATKAYVVHAGLLAAGAEAGNPVQFYPKYVPARGTEIEVTVCWKDEQGKTRRARAQDWVRDANTKKAMQHPWVFAGSQFSKNETTGERFYHADGEGDLICVSNFPSAVLDVPVKSSDSDASLMFDAFTERIPPRGTPVTVILTPKPAKESGQGDENDQAGQETEEKPPGQGAEGEKEPRRKGANG